MVFGPILFATGRATIRKRTYPVLDAVVATLNARPEITRLSIEGHTDSNGDATFNMMLSELRAKRVLSWLVDHGIAENRLEAHGFGQTNPIETNETKAGRKANRRVEFRIVGTSGTK